MNEKHGSSTRNPSSWLLMCCAPFTSCFSTSSRGRSKSLSTSSISWPLGRSSDQDLLIDGQDEKSSASMTCDQPSLQVSPEVGYREARSRRNHAPKQDRDGLERKHKLSKSFGSSRTSMSMRKGRQSDLSSRGRPQISGPTNFIHVATGTPTGTVYNPQARPNPPKRRASLEKLELSIYRPANRLSEMLPHFEFPLPATPPAARIRDSKLHDGKAAYQRKYSASSFHVPRRGIDSSPSATEGEVPPLIPRKALGRARAYTSPESVHKLESIAAGLNEIERLKKKIDEVIEKQSLYVPSRPGTPHSMACTMPDLLAESMPDIPALPPSAPSFAERLKDDVVRPQTAPLQVLATSPSGSKTLDEATGTFIPTPISPTSPELPLPPPLPLVLRPPLRKKKSFSRVSKWLSKTPTRHSRHISLDSVTNVPRPVKGTDGFYQCVPAGQSDPVRPGSFGSVGTVETWDSDEDEADEERETAPTLYSSAGTPVKRGGKEGVAEMETTGTFGRGERR